MGEHECRPPANAAIGDRWTCTCGLAYRAVDLDGDGNAEWDDD